MSSDSSKPQAFFDKFVAEKTVHLSGVDWQMVISTLEESADNCHRCERKGCGVCRMTRQIAKQIEGQL